jgi:ankyrin repeat protein
MGDINVCIEFQQACKNGHLQIVSKLLECKADINRTDNDGFSPLYVACRNGHVDIVCTLLVALLTSYIQWGDAIAIT